MDIQQLDDKQLAWLRKNFKEGKGFFVVKDSAVPNQHYCQIKSEVSYHFTCTFYCDRRHKCNPEKRKVNFSNYSCRLYEGQHHDK